MAEILALCACTGIDDLRDLSACDVHEPDPREAGERPIYDNESFWWATPIRETYVGIDRGPVPTPAERRVRMSARQAASR